MLIKALNEYYDILARNDKVCKEGFSRQEITHMIMLRKDGTISDIINVEQESEPDRKGKTKLQPISVVLPRRIDARGIASNIIEHRGRYIFGLIYDKDNDVYTTNNDTDNVNQSHEVFVEKNLEFTESMQSDIVIAYRNFMLNWNPSEEVNNEYLLNIKKYFDKSRFIFALEGHPEIKLHDMDGEISNKIAELQKESCTLQGNDICSITGEKGKFSDIHNVVNGNKKIVCAKNSAEWSYGKTKSSNSSIIEPTMKRYTDALSILMADKKHNIYLDDMMVVFWAMSDDDSKETDLFASMLGFDDKIDADEMNGILLKSLNDVNQGKSPDLTELDIDKNVEITADMFEGDNPQIITKEILAADSNDSYIKAQKELVDDANNVHMITVDKLYANEPINKNRLQDKNGDDVALSLKLPQGKVAYSFDAASVKSVDGYISEGDTVDVLVNKKDDSGNITTKIAYKDLKILRVSTNAENSSASQSGTKITKYSTLTVEVTKKQALKLYEIESEYDYKLILNPRR